MDREIINYLSEFMRNFREFKELMKTEQKELELIYDYIYQILDNEYIETANKEGIARFENILGINPPNTDSLADRRFRILARFNEQLPYTYRTLHTQMVNLCGASGYFIELKNDEYTLVVKVALTAKNNFKDVEKLLNRVIPANILIELSLLYNQHKTLANLTHKQLAKYTHKQLREDVMTNG